MSLEDNIASEWYINGATGVVPDDFQPPVPANHPLRLLTFCVLIMKDGSIMTGQSVSNDPVVGRKLAKEDAIASVGV